MPKHIPQEVKDEAVELRKRGFSYAEISDKTGVSTRWCKNHLKDVKNTLQEKYNNLYTKSKRKEGLSKAEIIQDMEYKLLPEQDLKEKLHATIRRVRANSKENIVRPNWMHPNFAVDMTNEVIMASMTLEDRCHDMAMELHYKVKSACTQKQLEHLPSVSQLKSAILGMSSTSVSQRGDATSRLNSWLESLHNTSVELSKRNQTDKIPECLTPNDSLDYQDLADFMY